MKQFTDTKTIYVTRYEAADGTVFDSKEECEKYERTADAAIRGAFRQTFGIDNKISPEGFMSATFYGGDQLFGVIIENEDELAVFNRFLKQIGSSKALGVNDMYKTQVVIYSEDGEYWYTGATIEELRENYDKFLTAIEQTAMRRFKQEDSDVAEKKADSEQV